MACNPAWIFTAKDDRWTAESRSGGTVNGGSGALTELDRRIAAEHLAPAPKVPDLPFQTGAIGWLSYDLGRGIETIPAATADDLETPDIHLAWYDEALVWDHAANSLWLVSTRSDGERSILEAALHEPPQVEAPTPPLRDAAESDFTRAEYLAAVGAIRDAIARGEYYQLNLVQRFSCRVAEDPTDTYLRLRTLNPAPFSAFLRTESLAVLCSSPEQFVHVGRDGTMQTCPIKGTRPRSNDAAEDAKRCAELLASPKERAELLMIVDLLRNDLGRVCIPGSVAVPRLHTLESFATVHHLVGEVRGTLRPGTSCEALLRAVFPGGSITGAPKISAMRAIERFERHRRGIAMGSIGYFSAHGEIDLNIAIRSAVIRHDRAYVSVGAGIVWDSDPAAEYAETLAKASALFAALRVQPPPS